MGLPPHKPATYDDLFDLPDHYTGQIVHGVLHAHPRPASRHAVAASALNMDVGSAFHRGRGGPGGWHILVEPELHLDSNVLVPDLAGWRRERVPALPDAPYFSIAPDWVCEVLSPSTARLDRVLKMPLYAAQGVGHCWIVDPRAQTLEVFRLTDGHWTLVGTYAQDAAVRAEPFAAVELELGALWDGIEPAQDEER